MHTSTKTDGINLCSYLLLLRDPGHECRSKMKGITSRQLAGDTEAPQPDKTFTRLILYQLPTSQYNRQDSIVHIPNQIFIDIILTMNSCLRTRDSYQTVSAIWTIIC